MVFTLSTIFPIPSGYVKIAIQNDPVKIVSFSIQHGDFPVRYTIGIGDFKKWWCSISLCQLCYSFPEGVSHETFLFSSSLCLYSQRVPGISSVPTGFPYLKDHLPTPQLPPPGPCPQPSRARPPPRRNRWHQRPRSLGDSARSIDLSIGSLKYLSLFIDHRFIERILCVISIIYIYIHISDRRTFHDNDVYCFSIGTQIFLEHSMDKSHL